jgi:hypothetical protein
LTQYISKTFHLISCIPRGVYQTFLPKHFFFFKQKDTGGLIKTYDAKPSLGTKTS